jgi:alkanesulfonate monooxygenase SsuD/methylene tetrahydromethanopterin reductase-like flavin-dependent oxidoreductase (luciferase family)
VDYAVEAERRGYDSVWTGELWGNDAFVRLAEIATKTDRVGLGTAIANVFSRSPAVLAMAAASLDRVSDGRARLGVGASTPTAIENLHGLRYERPIRRIHETVELVERLLSDEGRVSYDGEIFGVEDVPTLGAEVPVYNAALGPANRRVTGRLCDGWIPHTIPFDDLPEALVVVADAARERGRDPDQITVAPYVPSAVSDDPEEARDAIRGHVAYYVGSGEGYRRTVASRFPDEADRVAEAWHAGDRAEATSAVTDEMVDALGVAGTPERARERLREVAENPAVDLPLVVIPRNASDEVTDATIAELSPERS